MARATNELERLGAPRDIIAPWLTVRETRVTRLSISKIYIQPPAPLPACRPFEVVIFMRLSDLSARFEDIIPSIIATASADGMANISYLSDVL